MKEGYLFKKCEIFKWQKKYCVLNKACFCCFKGVGKSGKHAQRIFLCDIVTIEVDPASVKKPFSFAIRWKKGDNEEMVIFQAASREDRSSWIDAIMSAKEKELIREKEDPQRKSMKKLTNGLRRVTLVKNPLNSGFGCFLRSDHEGRIYVDRIDEQGPLAEMGILTEGDELVEIRNTPLKGKSIKDVLDVLSSAQENCPITVQPNDTTLPLGTLDITQHQVYEDLDECTTPPVPPKIPESFMFLEESSSRRGKVLVTGKGKTHLYDNPDYILNKMDELPTSRGLPDSPPYDQVMLQSDTFDKVRVNHHYDEIEFDY